MTKSVQPKKIDEVNRVNSVDREKSITDEKQQDNVKADKKNISRIMTLLVHEITAVSWSVRWLTGISCIK